VLPKPQVPTPSPSADIIAAIATAQGRGGVGVVRVSGNNIQAFIRAILGKLPPPRHASYSNFHGSSGNILDQGIAVYFPAPYSYTGEHVLELHGHGGRAILQVVLQRCIELGARLAQPGEFTQRAFLNGKLDLAQAESVADLIDANSAAAASSALRSLRGEFSAAVHELVEKLIHLRMLIEATLDFPEEELADDISQKTEISLSGLQNSLQRVLLTAAQGSLLRDGARVAIVGQPNVGKSSLLNRLAGEELALVSTIPGTTRDVIRQAIQIRGVTLHMMDTAGLRESQDVVESMGIERTQQTLQSADLILLIIDAANGITTQDISILDSLPAEIPRLLALNKTDLLRHPAEFSLRIEKCLAVSAKTGEGIASLCDGLLEAIGWRDVENGVFMARERHLIALKATQNHLNQAHSLLRQPELLAEELHLAQRALNEITGAFTSDDLLGEIFSRFCIGK